MHGYWAALASLRPVLGDADAVRLCRAAEAIVPGVRAFAESRGEDVWLREAGMVMVSAAPAQDAAVDARGRGCGRGGPPRRGGGALGGRRRGALLRRRSSGAASSSRTARPCIPGLLVRALRRAVLAAGVDLHERTPALRVRAGAPNVIETPGGLLRAREVVLATNAGLTGWRPAGAQPHELRLLRRAHRARAGAARRDRLDRGRGDRRRPHVPALLPHDAPTGAC